jgi:hypothetical protein
VIILLWDSSAPGRWERRLWRAPYLDGKEPAVISTTHAGAELDLLVVRGRTRLGFEIKRTSSPQLTPSMRHALRDLDLQRLDVIPAGDHTFPLAPKVRAVALSRMLDDVAPLA